MTAVRREERGEKRREEIEIERWRERKIGDWREILVERKKG